MFNTNFNIYFAGELFDHKHLIGNLLLAKSLEKTSGNKYKVILPQDHEQSDFRSVAIRDQDLKLVLEADLAIFNLDGPDADSGTVVEFMVAKLLDIPSVMLRTDFRNAGDGLKDGDPWNLMLSGYPRTENVILNSMQIYKEVEFIEGITQFHYNIGKNLIEKLDLVKTQKSIYDQYELNTAYKLAVKLAGNSFEELIKKETSGYINYLIESKINKGIYK